MLFRKSVTEPIRYGYAVGRVRVLEGRMLSGGTYERLLDASTFSEQKRVLSDSPYGRFLEEVETVDEVERGLDNALDELYGFLVTANLPLPVIRFFRVRYDYANLEARLKAELLGIPVEELLVGLGTVPTEVMKGPAAQLPRFMRDIYVLLSAEGDDMTEERITLAVDRALFEDLNASAKCSKSVFLAGLASLMVDLANTKALFRARSKNWRAPDAEALLLDGGNTPLADLMKLYPTPIVEIAEALSKRGPLKGVSAERIANLSDYDVLADDLIVRYLKRARMVATGPEPVIGYVMARQAEVMMLRMLLIGRLSGVATEVLRRRLRERYESVV